MAYYPYYLGQAVQIVAMAELLYALYVGFARGHWKAELVHLAFGTLLFIAGRAVVRRSARA